MDRRPRAFTLMELLVVMAIWGAVLAVLLPSLVAGREASRRLSCSNNLKQLDMALLNYQTSFDAFPAGCTDDVGPVENRAGGRKLGWIMSILPYMEQSGVWKAFDVDAGSFAPSNQTVVITRISTLSCPTESPATSWNWFGGLMGPAAPPAAGRTSYAACHHDVEAPIDVDNHGVFPLNRSIGVGDVADGLSQTLFLGELPRAVAGLPWASGTRASLRNTGHPINAVDPAAVRLEPDAGALPAGITPRALEEGIAAGSIRVSPLYVGGFGSIHLGGGANFAFGDGSVRFLKQSIDRGVYQRLGHRADGESIDDGAF